MRLPCDNYGRTSKEGTQVYVGTSHLFPYSTAFLRFMFTPVLVLEVTVGLQQSHHLGSYLHDSACCHEPRCRAYEGVDTCVGAPDADHVHGHLFSTPDLPRACAFYLGVYCTHAVIRCVRIKEPEF